MISFSAKDVQSLDAMRHVMVIRLSALIMVISLSVVALAGFALVMFGLLWPPVMDARFVVGGSAIAALAGWLLIYELGQTTTN
jgi:hypothetical protein